MAAGLGFKDFTTGEVLTAADVDGYLMQGVWVFASAAARDAAVTSPQEGNFAYLKDTNVTTYYTGSAWANLDTTGMTNPMTTTGDTIYSSSGSTPARLGIGTSGQVLTVSGAGVPSWATPAGGGGGKVLQVVNATYSTLTSSSTSTFIDSGLTATITPTLATSTILVIAFLDSQKENNSWMKARLLRGATSISTITNQVGYTNTALTVNVGSVGITYQDSPATTSATTYKVQFASASNNAIVIAQADGVSSITLMEIGA
jgi:hypothetical protein